jgi:two-component system sensor histidine kinase TtrS
VDFAQSHDAVVHKVLEGAVDLGTVRTGILESMAAAGAVELSKFRVIRPMQHEDFPLRVSTRLYPEWPFGKLLHTSNELAQRVAIVLLEMPPIHPAAVSGRYAGWTIPLDYQPVHDLLRELKLRPYDAPVRFTLTDVVGRYWHWMLAFALAAGSLGVMAVWVVRLNRELAKTKRRLERQHDLILDSVADGIYGVDLEGRSTFVNRAMERMTGWDASEVVGRNQHMILHHTHADGSPHPADECPVYTTFHDNVPRFITNDMFWRKDGSGFPVEYSSTPLMDERGGTVGAVVVFRDISARKAAEQRERKHSQELAHVARVSTMGEMASGIAHELNQPLAAIVNYAQGGLLALDGGVIAPEELSDILQRVAQQAQRAGEIIRQLRRFVRKDQAEHTAADINTLVRRVLLLLEPEIRQEGVDMLFSEDTELPAVVVQETQIEQVILNLVRNAVEAMAMHDCPEKKLTIRTFKVSEKLAGVEVTDTGPGFSAEVSERLFEPFKTTKKQGMGLGLSISRSIVEAHGGELTARSDKGRGATLQFTLPFANGG